MERVQAKAASGSASKWDNHACVFIPHDFVFTKKGANPDLPWVWKRMANMLMLYSWSEKLAQVRFLRHKDAI